MAHALATLSEVDVAYAWGAATTITHGQVLDFYAEKGQLEWYPAAGSALTLDHAPPSIAGAAKEAQQCLNFGARRAAVQMARAVVEATPKIRASPLAVLQRRLMQWRNRG